IYRNTGFAQLTNNHVTITLSFPSSLTIIGASSNTIVTTAVSSTSTSQLTSTTSSSLISTTSSISSPTSSEIFVTTSIASPIVPSTEAQPSSSGVPLTTLFLVIAAVIIVGGGFIGGIMFRNRKRNALSSYLTKIDSTYNQYAVDREECRSQLERIKRDAIEMLKNGKIGEGHFLMLDEKISQYLKDLTNTAAKQRPISGTSDVVEIKFANQTESGETNQETAQEATFCKNCGTKLASDEKLCRKCGTKR